MKNISFAAAVIVLSAAVPSVLAATSSPTPTADPSPAVQAAPAASIPSTGGLTTNGSVTVAPTGGSSTNGAVANPPVTPVPPTGGSSTNGSVTVTPTPTTPSTPSNGGGSFLGGGVGGLGGGLISTSSSSSTLVSATTTCPLITSYMKLGWNNDPVQVAKLQVFLKDSQHLDVVVNGSFDQKTETAVEAFQKKYLETVMGPWDATRASGVVYITTTKKVNELACNQPLTLTSAELAVINAYKANLASGSPAAGMNLEVGSANTDMATGTLNAGLVSDVNNTAAAGNASIFQRFWNFILSLFR